MNAEQHQVAATLRPSELAWNTSSGVQNPMKMSDIGFLKTEPNRTDLKIQETKTHGSIFKKNDFGGLGTVFHIVSFTIHLAAW